MLNVRPIMAAGLMCSQSVWHGDRDHPILAQHFMLNVNSSIPGPCSFQLAAFRSSDLPQAATGYLVADYGPTLRCEGAYSIPPGQWVVVVMMRVVVVFVLLTDRQRVGDRSGRESIQRGG